MSIIAGAPLALLGIASHNYLHARGDNWRMLCFNFTGFNFREWRISHVISHHIYTNTSHDLEMISFEWMKWIPTHKTELHKIVSVVATPLVWFIIVDLTILRRFNNF